MQETLKFTSFMLVLGITWADVVLDFLHIGDMHGEFDQVSPTGGPCRGKLLEMKVCVGGLPRVLTMLEKIKKEVRHPQIILTGNFMSGSLWTLEKPYDIIKDVIHLLNPSLVGFGSHEFDNGAVGFKTMLEAALPDGFLSSNMDFTRTNLEFPPMLPQVLGTNYPPQLIYFSYVPKETASISKVKNVVFYDEAHSINQVLSSNDRTKGNLYVVLGTSREEVHKKVISQNHQIDLLIAGANDKLFYNGPTPGTEKAAGPYPTVIVHKEGKRVPIMRVPGGTRYIGHLRVTVSDRGSITSFSGNPIYMANHIEEHPEGKAMLDKYRESIKKLNVPYGESHVILEAGEEICGTRECNFGNFVADAFVAYVTEVEYPGVWTQASVGVVQAGSIVKSIDVTTIDNQIYYEDLVQSLPYANPVCIISLRGNDVKDMFEVGLREGNTGGFLQVSGVHLTYDPKKSEGSRVTSIELRCGRCSIPIYEELDFTRFYNIVLPEYLVDGHDGYETVLPDKHFNKRRLSKKDIDIVSWYISRKSPISPAVEDRITANSRQSAGKKYFATTLLVLFYYQAGFFENTSVYCRLQK